MRAVRFSPLLLVGLALLPACEDDNTISTPLGVSWLEWSDSVTAGVPFGVRVYGEVLRSRDYLRIRLTVSGDTVKIEPFFVGPPCNSSCLATLVRYDTLVWVPAMTATAPRTVTVRASSSGALVNSLRTFGWLIVAPDTVVQPLTRSVGSGSGFQDSFGCYVISQMFHGRLVSADQSPPWAPGFSGFIYGRVDPVAGSPCVLEAPVILVDSIAM